MNSFSKIVGIILIGAAFTLPIYVNEVGGVGIDTEQDPILIKQHGENCPKSQLNKDGTCNYRDREYSSNRLGSRSYGSGK